MSAAVSAKPDSYKPTYVEQAIVEQYCNRVLDFVNKLDRPFTAAEVAKGCYFNIELVHSTLALLQTAKIISRANAKGLRTVLLTQPNGEALPDIFHGNQISINGGPMLDMGTPAANAAISATVKGMAAQAVQDKAPLFASDDVITGAAQGRLKTIIERVERLEEDKAVIMADLQEVYAEAKGEGFDVKILRKVVRLRKTDKVKRDEEEALLDLYLSAIGGL